MKRHLFGLLSLIVFSSASGAFAEIEYKCHKFSETRKWKVCFETDSESNNPDVLYYFHGIGGGAHSWQRLSRTRSLQEYWKKEKIDRPRVVALSFGMWWLLAEKNSDSDSGLYEFFLDEVFPWIEKELGGISGRRLFFGESMGGFNGIQLIAKRPDLFEKAALGCPIVPELSPFASDAEISAHRKKYNVSWFSMWKMLFVGKKYFPDLESWEKSSPLLLAEDYFGPETPPLHISCGTEDSYGIHDAVKKFSGIAKKRGVPEVNWYSLSGGHCALDPESLGEFLTTK